MAKYLLKRLAAMIPLLIGITIICFFVINLAPGSAADMRVSMNPKYSETAREKFEKMYGLDKPLYEQYIIWLGKFVRFDFGESFATDGKKVTEKIAERLPVTVGLNVLSMFFIFLIGLPLGVASAYWRNSFFDKTSTVIVFIGYAVPTFWLALICMYFFGVQLGWLPISGLTSYNYDSLSLWGKFLDLSKHLILPVSISVFGSLAGISRFARSGTLEVLGEEYITAARARGISEGKVLFSHALRNALLPVVTILGLSIPGLIGSSVIFESVFSIPGMGQLFYMSVMMRDYPTIMGILVIGALLTLIGNFIADIAYALADPRIRYGTK
ncbi:MAG: ABC transporter permease [Deferribacterales bacterium]|nr:ABC transporter permease [Deferribacterales bacterium]